MDFHKVNNTHAEQIFHVFSVMKPENFRKEMQVFLANMLSDSSINYTRSSIVYGKKMMDYYNHIWNTEYNNSEFDHGNNSSKGVISGGVF